MHNNTRLLCQPLVLARPNTKPTCVSWLHCLAAGWAWRAPLSEVDEQVSSQGVAGLSLQGYVDAVQCWQHHSGGLHGGAPAQGACRGGGSSSSSR
jgi:hypothetical protein